MQNAGPTEARIARRLAAIWRDAGADIDKTSLSRLREFVSVVGPSGCGKSTIFNIIAGVLEPSSGTVLIDGKDVTGRSGHVGYMLQKDLLLPWRTVIDNIVLGAIMKGGASTAQRREGRGARTPLRPWRFHQSLSGRAFRRHAPARGADAHARHASRRDAAG